MSDLFSYLTARRLASWLVLAAVLVHMDMTVQGGLAVAPLSSAILSISAAMVGFLQC